MKDVKTKKRGRGQPTLYKPEYCQNVVEMGKACKLPAVWALELGVDRSTLLEWRDRHPEFSIAYEKGKSLSKSALMNQVLGIGTGAIQETNKSQFNALRYLLDVSFNVREKQEVKADLNVASYETIYVVDDGPKQDS